MQRQFLSFGHRTFIHDLPNEILGEIFLVSMVYDFRHIRSYLQVTQVCRLWRELAFGLSALWRSFRLDAHILGDFTALFNIWCHNSHGLSMDIFIRTAFISPSFHNPIIASLHRVRSLKIRLSTRRDDIDRIAILSTQSGQVPLLENFELSSSPPHRQWVVGDGDLSISTPITIFRNAPKLNQLRISTSYVLRQLFIYVPWSQLVILELRTIRLPSTGPHFLSQLERLEEAELWIDQWEDVDVFASGSIIRSALHRLEITFSHSRRWGHFFSPLTLPSLHTLSISVDSNHDLHWPHSIMMDLHHRSGFRHNLSRFVLHDRSPSISHLIAFLLQSPSITYLELGSLSITTEFFELFTRRPPNYDILPNLLGFNITDNVDRIRQLPEIHYPTYVSMIKSRCAPHIPSTDVSLNHATFEGYPLQYFRFGLLQSCIAEGLRHRPDWQHIILGSYII